MQTRFQPEGCLLSTPENREYLSSLSNLEYAMREHITLEAIAGLCDTELSLHVNLGGIRGIIPKEEALFCRPGESFKDIAVITRVGKPVCFRITGIDIQNGSPVVLLSRRDAQKACAEEYLSTLRPGDLVRTKVTHLESFGAFVDIGCGLSSLLSVDCISVSRISHPKDRLTPGMYLWNVVRSVEADSGRIFTSMRELLGTWEQNAEQFQPGQTVTGVIRSVEDYGIFVELAPNLAGLAELRDDLRELADTLVGQSAAVYIKSIVPDRMKIKLVLIDICRTDPRTPPLRYYINPETTGHLDYWRYSPLSSAKLIDTVFA